MDDHRLADPTSDENAPDNLELRGHKYGTIHISGNAQVQLGDRYEANRDVFENGTPEQRRTAILNLLYYDALDLKREQLGADDFGPASFEWVKDTGFYSWLESGMTPFWIQGKPASGKSTLMKYLSESKSTYDALHKHGGKWKILHFFFDYRSGKNIANHMLGLTKLFLRQLIQQIPSLAEHLTDEHTRRKLDGMDTVAHVDLLADLIRRSDLRVCAFVDGLDEYDGDPTELCARLEALRDRTGMKLCLASRSELTFETYYAKTPTIVMQHHNLASINLYIKRRVVQFRSAHPFQSYLFQDSLQEAVADKAQGVILWARLVIDEMIKSCNDTTTSDDLTALLEHLPDELESVYERVLESQSKENQQDASVLLMLVDADTQSTEAEVIFQAWRYIEATCRSPADFPQNCDYAACMSRAKVLLGGLLDIVEARDEISERYLTLRLLHKSLSTYLRRNLWFARMLPEQVAQKYSDNVWTCLMQNVLFQVGQEDAIDIQPLVSKYEEDLRKTHDIGGSQHVVDHRQDTLARHYQTLHNSSNVFWWGNDRKSYHGQNIEKLESLIRVRRWSPLSRLLLYCIKHIDHFPTGQTKVTDSILFIHSLVCPRCSQATSPIVGAYLLFLHLEEMLSWLIAVNHGYYEEALVQLQEAQISGSSQTLQKMFDILIRSAASTPKSKVSHGLPQLIEYFAHGGVYIDGGHLCLLPTYIDTEMLWSFVSRRPPSARPTIKHHELCPYKHGDVSLLHHTSYQVTLTFSKFVDFGKIYGVLIGDLNNPTYSNGKHLFHRALYTMIEKHREGENIFVAIVAAAIQPDLSGGPNDWAAMAKSLRRKMKLKLWVKNHLKIVQAFDGVIRALEQYKANGNQWGYRQYLEELRFLLE